jgi:hypothetical protein
MQNNSIGGTGATGGNSTAPADGGNASAGNDQLQAAFGSAISQAQKTLQVTTEMGAILYAMKQRPQ